MKIDVKKKNAKMSSNFNEMKTRRKAKLSNDGKLENRSKESENSFRKISESENPEIFCIYIFATVIKTSKTSLDEITRARVDIKKMNNFHVSIYSSSSPDFLHFFSFFTLEIIHLMMSMTIFVKTSWIVPVDTESFLNTDGCYECDKTNTKSTEQKSSDHCPI